MPDDPPPPIKPQQRTSGGKVKKPKPKPVKPNQGK